MSTPTMQLPPRAGLVSRYGPLTGIVVAIALVAVLVTVTGRDGANQVATGARGTGAGAGSAGGDQTGGAALPVTYEQAKADGREKSITWVDNCDPATGRVKMPTVYAFPCVPKVTAPNPGATGPGVTADKITVVYYLAPDNADILAALAGSLDSRDATRETVTRDIELLNTVAATYGRKVEVVFYEGKASSSDALAARAEAQEVIDRFKPFASINSPGLTSAYAEELAAQGVLCIACGAALSDEAFQKNAPYLWGTAASPEQWTTILSDFVGKRLAGRPAKWAGDNALRGATRKFGAVNFEQDPPQFASLTGVGEACESVTGWKIAVHETYLATNMQDRAPTIIAKLKAEKVTTVIFMGDPVMPMTLTAEATKQKYFPEWIVTGTVLTDTTLFGRRYDPDQWKHAFGLSQLAISVPREEIDAWKLHQWFYGVAPKAEKTNAVIWPPLYLLFNGIHMAGPALTAENFKQGVFNLPPAGGGPTSPRVSYGDRKIFPVLDADTCKSDKTLVDYLGTDDMVEVWWDPSVAGPDEQGATDKTGKYRFANNGRRYLPGQMPDSDPDAFKPEGTVVDFKTRPDVDRAPDYPPPRR
jgi:hypothetical protein